MKQCTDKTALLLCALFLGLFCAIALAATAGRLDGSDQWAQTRVALLHSGPLTVVMRTLTHLGGTLFILCAGIGAAACCRIRQLRVEAAVLLTAVPGGILMHNLLKIAFQRPRPAGGLMAAHGWSFPSGHAMDSVIFYGMLAWLVLPFVRSRAVRAAITAAAAAVALAIGCSRIYLQVHYASDVLAGWAAGLCWLAGCCAGMTYRGKTKG